jgi:hypothetical protein
MKLKKKKEKKKNQAGSFKTVSYPLTVLIKTRDLPNTGFSPILLGRC